MEIIYKAASSKNIQNPRQSWQFAQDKSTTVRSAEQGCTTKC